MSRLENMIDEDIERAPSEGSIRRRSLAGGKSKIRRVIGRTILFTMPYGMAALPESRVKSAVIPEHTRTTKTTASP